MSSIATSLTCYYGLGQESPCLFLLTHIWEDQRHIVDVIAICQCHRLAASHLVMPTMSCAWTAKSSSEILLCCQTCMAPDCPTALKGCSQRDSPKGTVLKGKTLAQETLTGTIYWAILVLCARCYIRNPRQSPQSPHRGLMRQPARVLFHCAKIVYGTQENPWSPRTVDS